jgi:hypothetical protein
MRKLTVAIAAAVLCTTTALAQSNTQPDTTTTSGPSAWVYVSNQIGSCCDAEVHAWTAGPGGKLTPIPGSPFSDNLAAIALNGRYLFGAVYNSTGLIDTYRMQSDGAITYAASANAAAQNGGSCGVAPDALFLDHTGASLYDMYPGNCSTIDYQAWNIVKATGALSYLGAAGTADNLPPVNFALIGNNVDAYTSNCANNTDHVIYGFKRNSNGSLSGLNLEQMWPKAVGSDIWCPYLAAADPTNHLAVPVQLMDNSGNTVNGYFQLATYTVNTSTGALSTSSTNANMPKVLVGNLAAVRVSPSGKLVAISGTKGLQVFHMNGANPITPFTGLLTSATITDIRWDKNNHLYAISWFANRLVVFTVTPTSWKWVATYAVNRPLGIAVQPLPLPWQ